MNTLPSLISRRRFLWNLGGASLGAMLPLRLRGAFSDLDVVSILHTTDIHGNILPTSNYQGVADLGGMARCATRIRQWRHQQPNTLVMDCGDVYQGTDVGWRTEGRIITDSFNLIGYDGWVLGNHEFDWGYTLVENAINASKMPVICANCTVGDRKPVYGEGVAGVSANLQPFTIRETGGYRIAIIGLITPNLPNWFLPEVTGDFAATDPLVATKRAIRELKAHKPDAIVLAAHMGVRPGSFQDDAANRLMAISEECRELDLIIGGHTHRRFAKERLNGIPYTQADYFGIHCGRVDLVFNRETRKLLQVQPMLSLMDHTVPQDAAVLAMAAPALEKSAEVLQTVIGHLDEPLGIENSAGNPSDSERFIATAIRDGLAGHGIRIDAAIHGLLYQDEPVSKGPLTISDLWKIIPFENFTVVADIAVEDLRTILEEVSRRRVLRSVVGLQCSFGGPAENPWLESVTRPDGSALKQGERVRIAFNSYDAAGGGGRFPATREILSEPSSNRRMLPHQTRNLLIEFVQQRERISRKSLW